MEKEPTSPDAQAQAANRVVERRPTIQDIERLVDKFKIDRIFYLSIIGVCSIILMTVAIVSVYKGDWKTGLSILAPNGGIAFCISKVFKMWDDIMRAFFNLETDKT